MADITIESSAQTILYSRAIRGGIHWKTPLIGYMFYIDSANVMCYQKTTNGGQTWGGKVALSADTTHIMFDTWADWQTPGDAGTKIHILFLRSGASAPYYTYLDTATDTWSGLDSVGGGMTVVDQANLTQLISITKSRGGNFAVAFRCYNNDITGYVYKFYTSPDAGTWTEKTCPIENDNYYDLFMLFPGNEIDNQDLWLMYWDHTAYSITLKTFDNSANSWSESAALATNYGISGTYLQMDGAIRHSDGHLIFVAWTALDSATADLQCWDINRAGGITAKTNVITDTAEYAQCSIFIDQPTEEIYVAYLGGTAWGSDVHVRYQKSSDGGANWGGEQTLSVTNDDHRWISAGCMHPTGGGRFMPIWFNDDLNYVMTNYDNSIAIVAGWSGTIGRTTNPAAVGRTGKAGIKSIGR